MSGYAVLGPGRATGTLYLRRSHAERFNVNQAPDDNVRSLTTNGSLGTNLDWRWTGALGRSQLSVRTGVDATANRVHIRLFEESPVTPSDRTLTTDVKSPSWDIAGYALCAIVAARHHVAGGRRPEALLSMSSVRAGLGDHAPQVAAVLDAELLAWRHAWGADAFTEAERTAISQLR